MDDKNNVCMNLYDISIVIPHFNSSKSLEKLLNTIPKNKKIEVLIIDDKSEDIHVKAIEKILIYRKDSNTKFFINSTEKKSAGTCRNIGIENAQGKWLFFADADDYFTDDFYDNLSPYLGTANDVIFFMPDSVFVDSDEKSTRHIQYVNILNNYLSNKSLKNALYLKYKMYPPWLKMIKSEFIKTHNIEFDEIIASNDVMFSTKVGYFMNFFTISQDIIYVTTRSKGSLSVTYNKNVIQSRREAYISWYKFLKLKLTSSEFQLLNPQGLHLLSISLYSSVFTFINTLYILHKNNIPILSKESSNFNYIKSKIYERFIAKDKEKKYRKIT